MKKITFLSLVFLSTLAFAQSPQNLESKNEALEAKEVAPVSADVAKSEVSEEKVEFRVNFIATQSDVGFLFNMPEGEEFIVPVARLYRNEVFRLLPLFLGTVKHDGDPYDLDCKIYLKRTDTEVAPQLMGEKTLVGVLEKKEFSVIFPEDMFFIFTEDDEYGKYEISVEALNKNTGQKREISMPLELVEWKTPTQSPSQEDVSRFIFSYNSNFNKELLYASLFSKGFNFYKKSGHDGFDAMLFSFFRAAFGENQFLGAEILKAFPQMGEADRQKAIMLNAFMNSEPFPKEQLRVEDIVFQNYMEKEFDFTLNPYEGEILTSYAMELLWGEFFAIGNYAPIEKLLEVFEYEEEAAYADDVYREKLPRPSTKEEVQKFNKGRLYVLLHNYLRSYYPNQVLHRYLYWTIENSKSEKVKKALESILKEDLK